MLLTRPPGYLLRAGADRPRPAALHRAGRGRRPRRRRPATRAGASPCSTRPWRCGGASRWPSWATCPRAATDRLRLTELHVRARERRCDALLAAGPAGRRRHRPAAPGRRAPAARAAVGPAGHRPLRRRPAGRGAGRPAAAAPSCSATSWASTPARSCATSSRPCSGRTRSCWSDCRARCLPAPAPVADAVARPGHRAAGRPPARARAAAGRRRAGRRRACRRRRPGGRGRDRQDPAGRGRRRGRAARPAGRWPGAAAPTTPARPALWPWTQVLEQLGQDELTPVSGRPPTTTPTPPASGCSRTSAPG